jgi:hypothetical protein
VLNLNLESCGQVGVSTTANRTKIISIIMVDDARKYKSAIKQKKFALIVIWSDGLFTF